MNAGVLAAAALGVACAVIWAALGRMLLRRQVPPPHRRALRAFAIAWFAASGYALLSAILSLAVVMGALSPLVRLAVAGLTVLAAMVMAGGLAAYLVHLLTGSRHAVAVVAVLTLVESIVVFAVLLTLRPQGIETNGLSTRFVFAYASSLANAIIAISILAPLTFVSAGYLAALRSAASPTARWRIALVGGSLTLWVVTAILVRTPWIAPEYAGAARLAGAVVAFAVWAAYVPPRWVVARLGVESLADEVIRAPPTVAARKAADERARRVRELV